MKLEWQNNPPKNQMTWHEANEYAESLGDGWRLPTRGELCDAYDNKIKGFNKFWYWSSSTYAQGTLNAWFVHFVSGNVFYGGKTNYTYVRCVREVN